MIPPWILTRVLPGLLIAAAFAGAAWKIDANGYDRAEAKYLLQIATDKAAHNKALADAAAEAKVKYDAQLKNGLRQSELLIAAKTTIDAQTQQLKERSKDVSNHYREQPSAALQPVPGWIVTNGWLCDYNRAIGYRLPGAGTDTGGTENPACAADAFVPSGVSAERILAHHEEYGGYCRKLEQQIDGLNAHIEFIEGKPIK
jgi:hypothetical protein